MSNTTININDRPVSDGTQEAAQTVNRITAPDRVAAEARRVGKRAFLLAALRAAVEQGDKDASVRLLRALAAEVVDSDTRAMLPALAGWLNKASREHGWNRIAEWAAKGAAR